MVRNCSGAHCSQADPEINAVCKSEGWAVGHPVITRDANGICLCHCSCMALGTQVNVSQNQTWPVESIEAGDLVLAAGSKLDWSEVEVKFSAGTTDGIQPYTIYIVHELGDLIVTPDHLLFLKSGKLKRASLLSTTDVLQDKDGNAVAIKSVTTGTYYGGFHHIATSKDDPKGSLHNHLVVTAGVISGDYALQLFYPEGAKPKELFDETRSDVVVGTDAYAKKHGACAEPNCGEHIHGNVLVVSSIDQSQNEKQFQPSKFARVSIPDFAHSFITKEDAKKRAKVAVFRPFSDPDALAWSEYLVEQHKVYYPNVVFTVDWENDEVNAYAWVQNGVRHVAILGGLIRDNSLELEGISVVVAHEVGHLFGGKPSHPGGLSCEGQADYYGVRTVMRKVWFGKFYADMALPGIDQMAEFFGVPNNKGSNTGPGGCAHPPGACRIFTYNAAVDLRSRPSCAG